MVDVFDAQPVIESLKHEGTVDTVCVLPGEMMEAFDGSGEYVMRLEEIRLMMERSPDSGKAPLI